MSRLLRYLWTCNRCGEENSSYDERCTRCGKRL